MFPILSTAAVKQKMQQANKAIDKLERRLPKLQDALADAEVRLNPTDVRADADASEAQDLASQCDDIVTRHGVVKEQLIKVTADIKLNSLMIKREAKKLDSLGPIPELQRQGLVAKLPQMVQEQLVQHALSVMEQRDFLNNLGEENKDRLAELLRVFSELHSDIIVANSAAVKALAAGLASGSASSQSSSDSPAVDRVADELRAKVDETERERERAVKMIAQIQRDMTTEIEDLRRKLDSRDQDIRDREEDIGFLDREIKELRERDSSLDTLQAEHEAELDRNKALVERLEDAEGELRAARAVRDEVKRANAEATAAQAKVTSLESTRDKLEANNEALNDKVKRLIGQRDSLLDAVESLEGSLERRQQRVERLEGDMSDLTGRAETAEHHAALRKEELKEAEFRQRTLAAANIQLERRLEASEAVKKELEATNAELKTANIEFEAAAAELETRVGGLEWDLEQATVKQAALETSRQEATEMKLMELRKALQRAEADTTKEQGRSAALSVRLDKSSTEADGLKEKVGRIEDELASNRANLAALEHEKLNLSRVVENTEREADRMVAALGSCIAPRHSGSEALKMLLRTYLDRPEVAAAESALVAWDVNPPWVTAESEPVAVGPQAPPLGLFVALAGSLHDGMEVPVVQLLCLLATKTEALRTIRLDAATELVRSATRFCCAYEGPQTNVIVSMALVLWKMATLLGSKWRAAEAAAAECIEDLNDYMRHYPGITPLIQALCQGEDVEEACRDIGIIGTEVGLVKVDDGWLVIELRPYPKLRAVSADRLVPQGGNRLRIQAPHGQIGLELVLTDEQEDFLVDAFTRL